MKLKYNSRKRTRVKHNFTGFTTFEKGWWFNYNTSRWEQNPKAGDKGYSSHQSCRSVKAFRRKLKKAPKGVKFILVSRWVGHNVLGTGSFSQRDNLESDKSLLKTIVDSELIEKVNIVVHYINNINEYPKIGDECYWGGLKETKLKEKSEEYINMVDDLINESIDIGIIDFKKKYNIK